MNKLIVYSVITVMFLSLIIGSTSASVVILKDNRRIKGKIVEETPEYIRVKSSLGSVKIKRSLIKEIIRSKSKFEEYEEKLKAINDNSVDDHLKLAAWCKENKIYGSSKRSFYS